MRCQFKNECCGNQMEYTNFINPNDIFQLQYHVYKHDDRYKCKDKTSHNIYGPSSSMHNLTYYYLCDVPWRPYYPHTIIRGKGGVYMKFNRNNEIHVMNVTAGIISYCERYDEKHHRTFHVSWKGDATYTNGLITCEPGESIDRVKDLLRSLHVMYCHLF
jgi:hypothetical protein